MVELVECLDARGISPYAQWRDKLDPGVRARMYVATYRLASGNSSSVKAVGKGVHEIRMDFGPGYRIYFGKDGDSLILLLGGGTKKRQYDDIAAAKILWQNYKMKRTKEQPDGDHSKTK